MLHYTAMASAEAAVDWLCDPASEVSAHYVVGRDGALWQLVPEAARAWHAGAGAWGTARDVNSRSIGIELDNDGAAPFPAVQIERLVALLTGVCARWRVPPARVIGHSDCAPGRKIDPGPLFPWDRLAAAGLAVPSRCEAPGRGEVPAEDAAAFRRDLATIGYTAEAADDALVSAFRLRHRPGATGPLDATDCAVARGLARGWPVDRGARLA